MLFNVNLITKSVFYLIKQTAIEFAWPMTSKIWIHSLPYNSTGQLKTVSTKYKLRAVEPITSVVTVIPILGCTKYFFRYFD